MNSGKSADMRDFLANRGEFGHVDVAAGLWTVHDSGTAFRICRE